MAQWKFRSNKRKYYSPYLNENQHQTPQLKPDPREMIEENLNVAPEWAYGNLSVKQLQNINIRQSNICYIKGLPIHIAKEHILRQNKWFGSFGKIIRIIFPQNKQDKLLSSQTVSITYDNNISAKNAINYCMNNHFVFDNPNRKIKAMYGMQQYCISFLKKIECMILNCALKHSWCTIEDIINTHDVNQFKSIPYGLQAPSICNNSISCPVMPVDGQLMLNSSCVVHDKEMDQKEGVIQSGFSSHVNVNSTEPGAPEPKYLDRNAIIFNHPHGSPCTIRELLKIKLYKPNVCAVLGVPWDITNANVLGSRVWFGKFGRILDIHFYGHDNRQLREDKPRQSKRVLITFDTQESTANAIQCINNGNFNFINGRKLKATFKTAHYCKWFLGNQQCTKEHCGDVHSWLNPEDVRSQEQHRTFQRLPFGCQSNQLQNSDAVAQEWIITNPLLKINDDQQSKQPSEQLRLETKFNIQQQLISMGFKLRYIPQAFSEYERVYGYKYNIESIIEIITKYQNESENKDNTLPQSDENEKQYGPNNDLSIEPTEINDKIIIDDSKQNILVENETKLNGEYVQNHQNNAILNARQSKKKTKKQRKQERKACVLQTVITDTPHGPNTTMESLKSLKFWNKRGCVIFGMSFKKKDLDKSALRSKQWFGFGRFGNVKRMTSSGKRKNYIEIEFENENAASNTIADCNSNNFKFNDKPLRARYSTNQYCTLFLKRVQCDNRYCKRIHSWKTAEEVVPQKHIGNFSLYFKSNQSQHESKNESENKNDVDSVNNDSDMELEVSEDDCTNVIESYIELEELEIKYDNQNYEIDNLKKQLETSNKEVQKHHVMCLKLQQDNENWKTQWDMQNNNILKYEKQIQEMNDLYSETVKDYESVIKCLQAENNDEEQRLRQITHLSNRLLEYSQEIENYKEKCIKLQAEIDKSNENKDNGNDIMSENIPNVYNDLCEEKFEHWLCDSVRLKQYLSIFKKHEYNDITMVEYIDQDVIINELEITKKVHIKLLLRRIEDFKHMRQEFNSLLNVNQTLKKVEQSLTTNGILTINDLKHDVKTKRDVKRIFKTNNKQEIQQILNMIQSDI